MVGGKDDSPPHGKWENRDLEFLTLEQLYVKMVKCTPPRTIKANESIDDLLHSLNVVLRPECYDHLSKLMGDKSKVDVANEWINDQFSPFDARIDCSYDKLKAKGTRVGKCYWPDCP